MKKLFLFLVPIIILLCSCSAKPAELNRSFSAEVVSRYNGVKIKADLTADEGRIITLRIKSPSSMKDCTYTYKDGKVIVSGSSLKITADDNYLPNTAFAQVLRNILISLGRESNLKPVNNSPTEYKGNSDSGSFTLTADSVGNITSLNIKAIKFSAELVYK